MVWEYEYPRSSGEYHRFGGEVSEELEEATYYNKEQLKTEAKTVDKVTPGPCLFYPMGRQMVDMETGLPYKIRRKQPVTKYVTVGLGSIFKVNPETNELLDDIKGLDPADQKSLLKAYD